MSARAPDGDPRPEELSPVIKAFTVPGRILLIATVLFGVATFVIYVSWVVPDLPAGSYPLFMFLIPVALGHLILFLVAAWILERLGVKIYRD